jgi:hypothetical protein
MKNLLILGSGRSGTSMVAALFRNSGAFMGHEMHKPRESNPLGFYEDRHLNLLNSRLIGAMLEWYKLNRLVRPYVSPTAHLDPRGFWMAAPRRLRTIVPYPADTERMRDYCQRTPFCYKDPRFNVTLPLWRPLLPADTRFLVVFRDPVKTADSILRDTMSYTPPLCISERWAYVSWARNYGRLLDEMSGKGEWLFVHYDQVVDRSALAAIGAFSEAHLDDSEIDSKLSRAKSAAPSRWVRKHCLDIYQRLCDRAGRDMARWSQVPSPSVSG